MELVGLETQERMLRSCMEARKPALLVGATGTAKTSLAKKVALEVNPNGFVRVNLNGGTTPDKLEGRFQLDGTKTFFQYGVVPEAMTAGKTLVLDELNAALADTLFTLHPLLEEEPRFFVPDTGEEFVPHEDFRVIATMNPCHEYAGTKELNGALYSRFGAVIRFEVPKGEELVKVILSHVPKAPGDVVSRVVDVVDKLVELRQQELINTPIGVREAISAATFACDGLGIKEALVAAIANKLDPMEREAAKKVKMLPEEKAKAFESIEQLIELAHEAQTLERKCRRLERRMEGFEALRVALEKAGHAPVEEAEDEPTDVRSEGS